MDVKSKFPIFRNNPGLIYLDSAATSQKPDSVLEALMNFYSTSNANVHRGLYPLSEKATELYEAARKTIAEFINAEPEEIIFTSGTTDSINAVAQMLSEAGLISKVPNILLSELEHHSNILPWQKLSGQIDYIEIDDNYQLKEFNSDKNYDVLSVASISNVTGTIINFKELKKNLKYKFSVIDAAQEVAHQKIDVKDLDVDFLAFSGHKMFGPTGIGILYAKKELLEKLNPFRVGGGMIREVNRNSATWAPLPEKFEAGTPPIAEAIALAEAVKFIIDIGFDAIQKHENELRLYVLEKLIEFDSITIFHPQKNIPLSRGVRGVVPASGVISFSINGVHPHDLAQYLGDSGICLRAGHHCTQILHSEFLEVPASLRVSLSVYNSTEDIDKMIEVLKEGIKVFKK